MSPGKSPSGIGHHGHTSPSPAQRVLNFSYPTDPKPKQRFVDIVNYSKTCLKQPLSERPKMSFQYQLLLNAGQTYCRMLQREHSAILLTCIELPHSFKTFVLSIFEW